MPNTTNSVTANIIAQEDTTGNVTINRSMANNVDSTSAYFAEYNVLGGGTTILILPLNPTTQVYIKNNDTAKTVAVSWTPNGGALASIVTLNPGDFIILSCKTAGIGGVTSITLVPSVAGCLVEYFLGG